MDTATNIWPMIPGPGTYGGVIVSDSRGRGMDTDQLFMHFANLSMPGSGAKDWSRHGVTDPIHLSSIVTYNPSVAIIALGGNDLGRLGPQYRKIMAYYIRMINNITHYCDTTIILHSVMPFNKHGKARLKHAERLNMYIRLLARVIRVQYLHIWDEFLDASGRADESLMGDGVHYNNDGYTRWIHVLNEKIEALV
jgi:lysophospholipase L1-like esterase